MLKASLRARWWRLQNRTICLLITAGGRPELDLLNPTTIFHTIDRVASDVVINQSPIVRQTRQRPNRGLRSHQCRGGRPRSRSVAQRSTPLIHISTDYVFGGVATGPYPGVPILQCRFMSESKLEGERRVTDRCEKLIILRTAWVYSPFGRNFVKTMLRLAENGPEVCVVNDQIGNPTYASHLAAGILTMARQIQTSQHKDPAWDLPRGGRRRGHLVRFSAGSFQSVRTPRGTNACVRPISRTEYPSRANRPADSRLDCSKCAFVFGVRLLDWKIGVADCVRRLVQDKRGESYLAPRAG